MSPPLHLASGFSQLAGWKELDANAGSLCADSVAKVPKRRPTDFPQSGKKQAWVADRYNLRPYAEVACEFVAR
jgi:hypothetical protein